MSAPTPPPDYYKLGRFERCGHGCTGEWTDGQGSYWCCGKHLNTPSDPAVTSMMSLTEQEIVTLLRKMVANQQQIIDLLKDISIGLA